MSGVWVVLQQREGKLTRISREAVAAGQRLASELGGGTAAVVLGHGVGVLGAEVAKWRLDRVLVGDSEALESYTPGAYLGALAPAIERQQPAVVLLPHTYQSVDLMGRLAQRLGAALIPEVIAFEGGEDGVVYRRPVLGGKVHARVRPRGDGPVVVSVQSGAFPADEVEGGEAAIEALDLDAGELSPDRQVLGVERVGGDRVDLSKAEVIVAVGRGVGGEDKLGPVEELAKALAAEIGASRPVIDAGWLPRDRQIGSSGQTVAPKLYLALGISGAIQHLVGMKGSSLVVAVNKDPTAPIFGVADYGVVADLHELVPALLEAIREAREA